MNPTVEDLPEQLSEVRDSKLLVPDHRSRLVVTTTNDNLNALGFYQRRGFGIALVRPGAVDESRLLKPSIPWIGEGGIPLHDEIELDLQLKP